jgi:hypothetical protein
VRIGFVERDSHASVKFVDKRIATVIYDMILHSLRQEMHEAIVRWYIRVHSLQEVITVRFKMLKFVRSTCDSAVLWVAAWCQ